MTEARISGERMQQKVVTPSERTRMSEKGLGISLAVNKWEHLAPIAETLTPERRMIMEGFKQHPWFERTSPELQAELLQLPQTGKENHDGFLEDMVRRPDTMGGVEVISLDRLARGNFALIPIFNVKNDKGQEFTYEYVSWRYGPESGAKGIVFVKAGDEITDFIVLRGDKFATGRNEWDTLGGFADLNTEGVQTILDRIRREVQEELGQPDLPIETVHDLGEISPDAGMTNNRPKVFSAVITAEDKDRLPKNPVNPDVYELRHGPIVFPISQLPQILRENTDAFFATAVVKSVANGVLSPKYLVEEK